MKTELAVVYIILEIFLKKKDIFRAVCVIYVLHKIDFKYKMKLKDMPKRFGNFQVNYVPLFYFYLDYERYIDIFISFNTFFISIFAFNERKNCYTDL